MPLAISSLQTGHRYVIKNFGAEVEFEVVDIRADGDIQARHIHTLDLFLLSEITRYGKSEDFDLEELSQQ